MTSCQVEKVEKESNPIEEKPYWRPQQRLRSLVWRYETRLQRKTDKKDKREMENWDGLC